MNMLFNSPCQYPIKSLRTEDFTRHLSLTGNHTVVQNFRGCLCAMAKQIGFQDRILNLFKSHQQVGAHSPLFFLSRYLERLQEVLFIHLWLGVITKWGLAFSPSKIRFYPGKNAPKLVLGSFWPEFSVNFRSSCLTPQPLVRMSQNPAFLHFCLGWLLVFGIWGHPDAPLQLWTVVSGFVSLRHGPEYRAQPCTFW